MIMDFEWWDDVQCFMVWPDIHWLARDLGWAGGSHCVRLAKENEYAVRSRSWLLVGGAAPTGAPL